VVTSQEAFFQGRHIGLMEDADDERIPRLGLHSCPPTIPDWDGWWTPSPEDLNRIHLLMANEERMDFYCMEDSPDWMPVGGNPFPLFIRQVSESVPPSGLAPPTGGSNVPPLSSQAIAAELPFASSTVDQVMADILGMPVDGPRDPPSQHVPLADSCGPTGTTLGDGNLG
jgi:hypothetical protein